MRMLNFAIATALLAVSLAVDAQAEERLNPTRDILVTFDNKAARSSSAGLSAPYLHRKRYSIARQVRRDATAIAKEHLLKKVDHWPIRSLSIYCYVFRVPEGADRQSILAKLNADTRVESAQPLQRFETRLSKTNDYDDEYANLQYGLDVLKIAAAHRVTRGAGIRIAIVDSHVDQNHEDLQGRIRRVQVFSKKGEATDSHHGTAIASIIGAKSNNALGIVGIAPDATLELYVSCWSAGEAKAAVCDSFSLSKAIDAVLEDPPHVLNMSLNGPYDPLLARLIRKAYEVGVVVVAARPIDSQPQNNFPSELQQVIGVGSSPTPATPTRFPNTALYAPGNRILVAIPPNRYDFRSGSSLAAAHVSGVAALLLAVAPGVTPHAISNILVRSQLAVDGTVVSINACDALNLAGSSRHCGD